MAGIRAELEVQDPGSCPVAETTAGVDGRAHSVERTSGTPPVVEQFRFEGEDCDAESVFEYEAGGVYRISRSTGECVCDTIESLDCPVDDVWAEDGSLYVTLHLASREKLRTIVERLEARFHGVSVKYLDHSAAETSDVVSVDRGRLTDRQHEVLSTAYELGYFEHPRETSATEVAERLDITASTLNEHLSAAQSKLLADVVEPSR